MSAIKAGDKIYFQGNQGKVMRVTHDENEPLLEVVLTQKRVAYLKPSQLDLYPFAEQLNENQQTVLEWLKEEKTNSSLTAFDCIYSFIYGNPEDLVTQIWSELNAKEEAQVLEAFGKWAQEQEEKQ